MGLLSCFYPDELIPSAYDIDYAGLYEEGIRGIIFDIDNTLVPHGAPADERAVVLFEKIRASGLKTCLISNNKPPRVEPFAKAVGSPFVADAHKPSGAGYEKGCEIMGTEIKNTVFIGDQIFTDIWGAKRAGMRNILTRPINPKEEIQIVLKRILERIVLFSYRRSLNKK